MKFSIKDISSVNVTKSADSLHLLKKFLMENFIFAQLKSSINMQMHRKWCLKSTKKSNK